MTVKGFFSKGKGKGRKVHPITVRAEPRVIVRKGLPKKQLYCAMCGMPYVYPFSMTAPCGNCGNKSVSHRWTAKKPRRLLAKLTPQESRLWDDYFGYYVDEGKSDDVADRLAWRDLKAEFPRLKAFQGALPD